MQRRIKPFVFLVIFTLIAIFIQVLSSFNYHIFAKDLSNQDSNISNHLSYEQGSFQSSENNIDELYALAIPLGRKLDDVKQIPPPDRTQDQDLLIAEIQRNQRVLQNSFTEFVDEQNSVELFNDFIDTLSEELKSARSFRLNNLISEELNGLREKMKLSGKDPVLLYPVEREDTLELILVTPYAPPIRHTVYVNKAELISSVAALRYALESPERDAFQPAEKLYDLLIRPVENYLSQSGAKSILFYPAGVLSYVPLATMYDGKNWLIERFDVHNIISASLGNGSSRSDPQVLIAAATNGQLVDVDGRSINFSPLPGAAVEADKIAAKFSKSTILLDNTFTQDNFYRQAYNHNIVHIAAHAFLSNPRSEASSIVLGDGSLLSITDFLSLSFPDLDLIVLSGCETALGSITDVASGEEVFGLDYLLTRAGARSTIASLWSVSDSATQILMDSFYNNLLEGFDKSSSLRKAQASMINGEIDSLERSRSLAKQDKNGFQLIAPISDHFDKSPLQHPYYWAPFILMEREF